MSNETNSMYDVAVVGGGAAGMMAAAVAAKNGSKVVIIEQNERLGEKLAITGGGRCNITNAEDDVRVLLGHYGKAQKFLFSAFSRFGVQDTIAYFRDIGVPIKVEAHKRAFPESESAEDVVTALYNSLIKNGVTILAGTTVKDISISNGLVNRIKTSKGELSARSYIFATGGTSRPETGSTGDGFTWLAKHGHNVRPPTPNVTPLKLSDDWLPRVAGVALSDVDVIFFSNGVRNFKVHGKVLFTHFGISGPTILNSAYKVAELLEQGEVTAEIDCFPKMDIKELDRTVQATLQLHPAKNLKNTISYFAPPGMHKVLPMLLASSMSLETNNSELSKINRLQIVKLLKAIPISVEQLMGFEKAVVADGGVSLKDIDTRTMQSKVLSNVYIVGDLLDINRPSGGYSLQLCWTTGYIAGMDAGSKNA